MADLKEICKYLTPDEILAQMAEEAAEVGHAGLKLRRALIRTNPTPKTVGECLDSLQEEFADVLLSLCTYCEADHLDFDDFIDGMGDIMVKKSDRWLERLKAEHDWKEGSSNESTNCL